MPMRRVGQILVDLGFINDEQLAALLQEQKRRPDELVGKIAESMGLITDEELSQALAEQMDMQVIRLAEVTIPQETLDLVSEPMATLYRIVPVSFRDDVLTIATSEPQNVQVLDELRATIEEAAGTAPHPQPADGR